MVDLMAKFGENPLPGNVSGQNRLFIKDETGQRSSCSLKSRDLREHDGRTSGMKCDKVCKNEESQTRSLSPEFLLKTSAADEAKRGDFDEQQDHGTYTEDEDHNTTSNENGVNILTTCVYCNEIFPDKTSVEQHEREMHNGKKSYDCPVCKKQFTHRSSRNIHLRVHTGQRPYECDICKKRFRVSSHLRDHVRTHTGERPFKCVLCGRGFKQSSDMKKHRKTHFKTSPTHSRSNKKENDDDLGTSYMIVRPDEATHMDDDHPSDELTSPNEHPKNLKLVIKVERKSKEQNVASPLSCDSGVKVESDNSPSPENNTTKENLPYQEPARQTSATVDAVSTAGWPVTACTSELGNSNNSNDLAFKEYDQVRRSMPSIGQPLRSNVGDYRVRNVTEALTDESGQCRPGDQTKYVNGRFISRGREPVSVATKNNEANQIPNVTAPLPTGDQTTYSHDDVTYKSDGSTMRQANFPQFRGMANTEMPSTLASGTVAELQPDSEGTRVDGTQGRLQGTTEKSQLQGINAGSPERDVNGPSSDAVSSNAQVIRKPVVVKLKTDKTSSVLRKNTIVPLRKQAKPMKKVREGVMQCTSCMERFRSLELFTAHKCDKDETSFKCSVCSKTFARPTLLRQHMVLHQGSKRFKFKCNYCGRAFRHRSHLRDHERIHTGERPFKCSFCPKAFKQSSDLRKHENLHTGATRYRCEKCAVDFKRCDALKKHALLHAEGEVTLLKCDRCQSLFATADGHSSHMCQNRDRYRCQLCVQMFPNPASLRQHCHQEHRDQSNETCLKCEFCKLELQSLEELEEHLGTHKLLKTHKCNVCGLRFSLISQLEEHAKVHHQNSGAAKGDHYPSQAFQLKESNYPTTNLPQQQQQQPISNSVPDLNPDKFQQTYDEHESANYKIESTRATRDRIPSDTQEKIPEVNTAAVPLAPVYSSSTAQPHLTYDFIPSSYQSLVHSRPMHLYYGGARRAPLAEVKKPGSYQIPRLIKAPMTTQHDRDILGRHDDVADEHTRARPAVDDERRSTESSSHGREKIKRMDGEAFPKRRLSEGMDEKYFPKRRLSEEMDGKYFSKRRLSEEMDETNLLHRRTSERVNTSNTIPDHRFSEIKAAASFSERYFTERGDAINLVERRKRDRIDAPYLSERRMRERPEVIHLQESRVSERMDANNVSKEIQEKNVDKHFSKSLGSQMPKRKYTCLNCRQEYYNENTLASHVCDIPAETIYLCSVCEEEFSSFEDLQGHMRNHWKTVVYFRCTLCGDRVKSEELLKEHNLRHMERDWVSEEPKYEGDKVPTMPWVQTKRDKRNVSTVISTTVTSLSTPVITSVGGKDSMLLKDVGEVQTAEASSQRGLARTPNMPRDTTSPLKSPLFINQTAGHRERGLPGSHSTQDDAVRGLAPTPQSYVTYFEARKPVQGGYLNVFGQGSAMVVSAMHSMDASGRYPGGTGLIYPLAMNHQGRITEQQ